MRPIRQQQIHHSGVAELGIVLERRLIAVGSPHLDVSPVVDQELSDAQVGVRLVAAGRAGASGRPLRQRYDRDTGINRVYTS